MFKLLICATVCASGLLAQQAAEPAAAAWRPLFDGKTLTGWTASDFFGAGKVTLENGVITLGAGAMTGINWAGPSMPFPRTNYEVRIEAARIKGSDFFAGITFPVGDSYCSWINGGWGGQVVGLSSIDGADASNNETTSTRQFELGVFYTLRLRVTPTTISAWIGDERVLHANIENKSIALREGDIEHSIPFGIATYSTVGAVRKIEWRPVAP